MEDSARSGRYVTLRDYLLVLRRYAIPIVLITAIGAAAGYLDAKRQTKSYEATAAVAFHDPTQDVNIVGFANNNIESPVVIAAKNGETISRPAVVAAVNGLLGTKLSRSAFTSAISTTVSPQSGLLDITAKSSSPAFATRLANAAAQVAADQDNTQTKARFAAIADDTRRQIAHLQRTAKTAAATNQLVFYEDELGRLVTLSRFANGAQISQVAPQPTTPVGPKTVRSTVIGLIVGLLLGIALAFIRDAMDRRLRSASDIESHLRFPVIGHVRHEAMGRIPQLANGASGDYKADLEAFRIMRRNLEYLDVEERPRSFIVTSAVSDEGKTTVASSLAFAMTAAGKRTLLVECDLRRPSLATRLGIESSPGMTDYLEGRATPAAILRRIVVEAGGSDGEPADAGATTHELVVIPAGSPTSHAAELLGSNRFGKFLAEVRDVYDVVVIDSTPLLPVADTLEMLPHVDGIIVCVRDLQTTREEALAAKAALARFPNRPTGLVVTDIKSNRDRYELYNYSYSYG